MDAIVDGLQFDLDDKHCDKDGDRDSDEDECHGWRPPVTGFTLQCFPPSGKKSWQALMHNWTSSRWMWWKNWTLSQWMWRQKWILSSMNMMKQAWKYAKRCITGNIWNFLRQICKRSIEVWFHFLRIKGIRDAGSTADFRILFKIFEI